MLVLQNRVCSSRSPPPAVYVQRARPSARRLPLRVWKPTSSYQQTIHSLPLSLPNMVSPAARPYLPTTFRPTSASRTAVTSAAARRNWLTQATWLGCFKKFIKCANLVRGLVIDHAPEVPNEVHVAHSCNPLQLPRRRGSEHLDGCIYRKPGTAPLMMLLCLLFSLSGFFFIPLETNSKHMCQV